MYRQLLLTEDINGFASNILMPKNKSKSGKQHLILKMVKIKMLLGIALVIKFYKMIDS